MVLPYDGFQADVFSLGVCLYIMTFGVFPFNTASPNDPLFKFMYSQNPQLLLELNPQT
jgi:serine/threonine protein kinase